MATRALLVLSVLFFRTQSPRAVAAEPSSPSPPLRNEWIGVEASPVWAHVFQVTRKDTQSSTKQSSHFAVGAAGTLRFFRMAFDRVYWTPVQIGVGVGVPESSFFVHASTELGLRLRTLPVELGLALGAGVVGVTYAWGCDGDCMTGGYPVVLSPVVRVAIFEQGRVPVAAFVRAIIPTSRPHEPSAHFVGFAMPVLVGIDIGINRL